MALLRGSIFALLASAALAIDIPSTPVWPDGRCTDKSLTIPSWIVHEYVVKNGVASFQVVNRVPGATGSCCAFIDCYPGKEDCEGSASSDEMRVKWKKGPGGKNVISISEFWYCADEGQKTIFTASGSTTITSCEGDNCVSPITYLAQGSLTVPVALTPAQPSPPPGYDATTCANVGGNQWKITGVEYKTVSKGQCKWWYMPDIVCVDPGDPFVSKGEYLKLNVTNKAISHEVACNFVASYGHEKLPSTLRCTGGNFNEITLDVSWSGSAPNFRLKVEELWYCLEKPLTNSNPSLIVATGSKNLTLSCSNTTGITGTADDIITTCTTSSSVSINGVQTTKNSLPPFSLITAWPAHGGCTFDSIISPTLYYRTMYFSTNTYPAKDPNSATLSRFSASLSGPGFQDYSSYVFEKISGNGVDTVYTCAVYYDGKPRDQHWNCTYAFNPHTKVITQEKTWVCSDKDPAHPLYFTSNGVYDWSVDPYYTCERSGGDPTMFSCMWMDDMASGQGIPFNVQKIRSSLVNVLPPDYGQPTSSSDGARVMGVEGAADHTSDTVMVKKGEWKVVGEST